MRRTAEDAARTRLALLKAALMAFEEKGWRGATFEYVAECAGVTRGALHHHFSSKTALLSAALERGWNEYGNRLFEHGEKPASAGSWLYAMLADFVSLLRDDRQFRALATTTVLVAPLSGDDSTPKHTALRHWRDRIAAVLEHTGTCASPVTTAGLVLVLLQGFTITAVTHPEDLPQPDAQDAALAGLVKGMLNISRNQSP